ETRASGQISKGARERVVRAPAASASRLPGQPERVIQCIGTPTGRKSAGGGFVEGNAFIVPSDGRCGGCEKRHPPQVFNGLSAAFRQARNPQHMHSATVGVEYPETETLDFYHLVAFWQVAKGVHDQTGQDRKSTRLNSSHVKI